jgi:hypothetical protein
MANTSVGAIFAENRALMELREKQRHNEIKMALRALPSAINVNKHLKPFDARYGIHGASERHSSTIGSSVIVCPFRTVPLRKTLIDSNFRAK